MANERPLFYLGTMMMQSTDAFDALDAHFAAGGRHLDTARVYGGSERTVGDWIRSRGVAGEMRVLTKGAHPDDSGPRLSRADILTDVRTSLDELGLERVDCYLLHMDHPSAPVEDIAATLTELVATGVADRIGVSNWRAARVEALADALDAIGGPPIVWVSNCFGLAYVDGPAPQGLRTVDAELRALSARLGFGILAWSPLSAGYFAGGRGLGFDYHDNAENLRRAEILRSVAARHGVDPIDLLVHWVSTIHSNIVPVLGSATAEHVRGFWDTVRNPALDPAAEELSATVGPGLLEVGDFTGSPSA